MRRQFQQPPQLAEKTCERDRATQHGTDFQESVQGNGSAGWWFSWFQRTPAWRLLSRLSILQAGQIVIDQFADASTGGNGFGREKVLTRPRVCLAFFTLGFGVKC